LLTGRALLLLLAGASLVSILCGVGSVSAAAADTTPHHAGAGPTSRFEEPRDRDRDRRDRDRDHDHHRDRDRDRSRRPDRTANAAPASKPLAPPTHASAPVPRSGPRDAAVTALSRGDSSLRPSSFSPGAPTPPRPGVRPPVLAPPSLTIPANRPPSARGRDAGAGYVVALSTVLVVATIAMVSLVLIRRSG
jgi:hypothetical protein